MTKKLLLNKGLLLLLFIGIALGVKAQEYKDMILSGQHSVFEIQSNAEAYFKDKDKGRGSGYVQFKRWEYNALRLADENGFLQSQDELIAEWERTNVRYNSRANRYSSNDLWEEMGPTYWNATSGWNPGVGRITGFTVDPQNMQHIIVGAETGGVWRTTDGAQTWTPLCDFFSNMRVYATAMHPDDKNIYFFGSDGGRIYRSTDAGATWTQLGVAGNSLVNKILIHPQNPQLLYATSQNSGIYRSEDGGQTWVRKTTDNRGYDVQFKPDDLNTVYASGNSFHKSTDGGITFQTYTVSGSANAMVITGNSSVAGGYDFTENNFSPGSVSIPTAPNAITGKLILYQDTDNLGCNPPQNAAAMQGNIVVVRRGSCNFTTKVLNAQQAGAVAVIVVNNTTGTIAMGGGDAAVTIPAVSITQADGNTIISALIAGDDLDITLAYPVSVPFSNGAKMIGVSADDPSVVYVVEANASRFNALYKSFNEGVSFTKFPHTQNFFGYSTQGADESGQAPRDMAIAVNPFDVNEVHIAGILTWRSLNGGQSFDCSSDWVPSSAISKGMGYCHADVDILEFVGASLYAGTDGGLFVANSTRNITTNYYRDLTTGLGIRQFYKIGVSQTNSPMISGGSQDNGTSLYTEFTGWIDWLGADGMETFIDKFRDDRIFGTSQFGKLYVSNNGGMSRTDLLLPGSGRGNWVTPLEQDPVNENTLYLAYDRVFKSTTSGTSWTAISQQFSANINHLKVATSNPNIMFCALNAVLYKTTTASGTWETIPGNRGRINSIAIHPTNENKIAIATAGTGKVFVSDDGGDTWEEYRKNLPNFSALSLVWHDNDKNGLYLGMNYGIFYIEDEMEEWMPFSNLLPNVIINELEINLQTQQLYAATYGRGLWVSPLFNANPNVSVNEIESNIKVYPNPTREVLNIEWNNENNQPQALYFYDIHGKVVRHLPTIKNAATTQLNVQNLTAGTYFLKLVTKNGAVTKSIIVE